MTNESFFKCLIILLRKSKYLKFRYYEKAKKFEKISHLVDKTGFLLGSVKTSGRFFQIFVAFSEKLNFNEKSTFFA